MGSRKRKIDQTGSSDVSSYGSSRVARENNEEEERECASHKNSVFEGLVRLKSEGKACDFVVAFEGEEMPVHKAVLAASSTYFEAMITHKTVEKKNSRVEVRGVELNAGKKCIDFMYTGKAKFSVENPEKLIYAAELMALPPLTDMYFEFLKEKLGIKNCLQYLQLAEVFHRESFVEIFKKFSIANFEDVIQSSHFVGMSETFFTECLQSISSRDVTTEHLKWAAITKWVHGDVMNRKENFKDYFSSLKLEYFPNDFLKETLLKEELVSESESCKEMILNALLQPDRNSLGKRNESPSTSNTPTLVVCSLGGMLFRRKIGNSANAEWSRSVRIPPDILHENAELIGIRNKIFLTSGDSMYSIRENNWNKMSDSGVQFGYHRCVATENFIYIITSEFLLKYDIFANDWEQISVKLPLTAGFFVASSDTCVYAMGGETSRTDALEFEFKSPSWYPIARMNFEREYGAAVVANSYLYAIGGRVRSDNIEQYDPRSNLWTNLAVSEYRFFKCKAFVFGNELYVVGGGGRKEVLPQPKRGIIQYYICRLDLTKRKWIGIKSMDIENDLSCVVYD